MNQTTSGGLQLRFYGNSVLRQKAKEIDDFGPELVATAERMFEVMYENDGIGLAGNQVGLLKRIVVLDVTLDDEQRFRMALCNPRILSKSGEETGEEGCLSIPEVRADVTRCDSLTVEAESLEGRTVRFDAGGLLARAIQHEIDHLDGVLFIDRISPAKRKMLESRLKQIAREYAD